MTDERAGLRVFVSYRRDDAPVNAGRIADNLEFRNVGVFLDTEMPPGIQFANAIAEEIQSCDAFLAVIGRQWLAEGADGQPAIAHPEDWVHIEIHQALERGVLFLPILVDGAEMPRADQLPDALKALALRNAIELRRDTWRSDFERLYSVLPRPSEEEPASSEPVQEYPARFTDAWFRTHVPNMTEAELRPLRAKLYERNWSDDEIEQRVMVHSPHSRGGAPDEPGPGEQPAPHVAAGWTPPEVLELDADDPVAVATQRAAFQLAELGRDPRARIIERTLANALAAHLDGGIAERRIDVPGWMPQPGNVDVLTRDWRGRPNLVIETKLKDDDRILEVLWDAAKLASVALQDHIDGVYLVVGSTEANWRAPGIGAQFLETGRHEMAGEIGRNDAYWEKYILGDSTGRPEAVPAYVETARVARVGLDMRGARWEIRAARLEVPEDGGWVAFEDGRPPR